MNTHPLVKAYPLMSDDEFQALKADIKENGLKVPITIYQGVILDGRHRARACDELGIEPEAVEYNGDDPEGFVFSLNYVKRHLNQSQKACIAALRTKKALEFKGELEALGLTVGGSITSDRSLEKMFGVSRTHIRRAIGLMKENLQDFVFVFSGEKSLSEIVGIDDEVKKARAENSGEDLDEKPERKKRPVVGNNSSVDRINELHAVWIGFKPETRDKLVGSFEHILKFCSWMQEKHEGWFELSDVDMIEIVLGEFKSGSAE